MRHKNSPLADKEFWDSVQDEKLEKLLGRYTESTGNSVPEEVTLEGIKVASRIASKRAKHIPLSEEDISDLLVLGLRIDEYDKIVPIKEDS